MNKNNLNNQKGGLNIVPKQIPMFKDGKATNPFMSNDQQAVNKAFATEKNVRQMQQQQQQVPTLLELKINDQIIQYPDPKKPQASMDPVKLYEKQGIYPSPYVPIPNPFYPTGVNPYFPYSYQMGQMPLIKKYNITISNENGDLTKLHDLYEDVLPQKNGIVQKTLTTIAERTIIYQYLRSIFVRHNDGEDISFNQSTNSNTYKPELVSLLSHIKIMEFNPYHFSRITNNPYSTIPDSFVMFRSCYPIRLGTNGSVQCALDNINLNIRIYQLRVMDVLANKVGYFMRKLDCDTWREIAYYEFIREKIIKSKVCPNFIMVYSWYMTYKSGVDFMKLKQLKKDRTILNTKAIEDNTDILIQKLKDDIVKYIMDTTDKMIDNGLSVFSTKVDTKTPVLNFGLDFKVNELNKINVQYPTNRCIVMITEGPTQNLFDWATRSYSLTASSMPIKKMTQTGFHDIKVWQSVIFQMLVGMYVMKINKIAFNGFSIENNIYIKDLNQDDNVVGYWKYKINGIEFYVPNYGYLVVIDSKYHEVQDGIENVDLSNKKKNDYMYKIYASMFNDVDGTNNMDNKIDELNKTNMLNVFNVNNFNVGFSQYGGIKPDSDIYTMISEINAKISNDDSMTDIFISTQRHFLNNRLGQFVKDIEKDQIVNTDKNFIRGSLIAHKFSGIGIDSYTWGLCLRQNGGNWDILTVDPVTIADQINPKLQKMINVQSGDIFKVYGYINQTYKPNQKLTEEDILETYTINE